MEIDFSELQGQKFRTILADPPWDYLGTTHEKDPEFRRMHDKFGAEARRPPYRVMKLKDILKMGDNISKISDENCVLFLWIPNSIIKNGLDVIEKWGFSYKSNIVWVKTRLDGLPNGGALGHYVRNCTELLLFGIKGKFERRAKNQVNVILAPRTCHSKKPVQTYEIIENLASGPYLELFARNTREGWTGWGDEIDKFGGSDGS